ncbi:MAG: GtrA family protein [Patescibacteria group bacterium]
MLSLSRKDVVGSLVTGVTAGVIVWQLAVHLLEAPSWLGVPFTALPVVTPLLWIIGVELGHWLGRRWHFFSQFGRFVAIGLTNAAVDFGLFNLLFAVTGRKPGLFLWINIVTFVVAVTHSFLWNKFWTFESNSTHNAGREFGAFILVNVIALCFNVGTSYLTFRELVALADIGVTVAANIGKVAGSLVGLIFNFVGFRLVVFKKSHEPFDDPYVV